MTNTDIWARKSWPGNRNFLRKVVTWDISILSIYMKENKQILIIKFLKIENYGQSIGFSKWNFNWLGNLIHWKKNAAKERTENLIDG